MPRLTFWVRIHNSTCHKESQMPHPPDSPDIISCDYCEYGMLNEILRDCEFHSNDEIESATGSAENDAIFDDMRVYSRINKKWLSHVYRQSFKVVRYDSADRDRLWKYCLFSGHLFDIFEIRPDKRISNNLPVSMPFIRRKLFINSCDPYLRAQFGNRVITRAQSIR
jgi:hypothetical protein